MRKLRSLLLTLFFAGAILFAFLVWDARSSERQTIHSAQISTTIPAPAADSQPVESIAVNSPQAPVQASNPSENSLTASQAIKDAPDVGMKVLQPGTIMIGMTFGPCGILYKRSTDFLWHPDPGVDQAYPDLNSAVAASYSECEGMFHQQQSLRSAAEHSPAAPGQP